MCWYMWRSLACPSTSRTLFSGLRVSTHGKQVASLLARFLLTAQGMGVSGLFVCPGPARGFSVNCGLKQYCCLSTLFFNLCINDLFTMVNALNVGIKMGSKKVAVMLYADDLVLMAENEHNLQLILHTVHE